MGKGKNKTSKNGPKKKSRKQLLKEQEELRLKQKLEEEEKQRLEKLEKDRRKKLAKLAKEKEQIELEENKIRNSLLTKSCELFHQIKIEKLAREVAVREQEKWEHYLQCDGKPDSSKMDEMNYYLYAWKNDPSSDYIKNLLNKSDEVYDVLDLLQEYIRNPLNESEHTVNLWKEMRQRYQEEFLRRIDNATYNIIHNVNDNMEHKNKYSATSEFLKPYFTIGLWAKKEIAEDCPSLDSTEPFFPVAELPSVYITINVPYQLAYKFYVIRVCRFKYDYQYSELSRTWKPKKVPDEFLKDLCEYNNERMLLKEKLQEEYTEEVKQRKAQKKRRLRKQSDRGSRTRKGSSVGSRSESSNLPFPMRTASNSIEVDIRESFTESISSRSLTSIFSCNVTDSQEDLGPLKSPSETMILMEDTNLKYLKRYLEMQVNLDSGELNLRQFMILGGVYLVDFIEALPQPVTLPDRSIVCLTYGEQCIKYIAFDPKNNYIQRKSLRKLKEYYEKLSSCLDLGKLDQRGSLRDLFLGMDTRPSKYYIPGELKERSIKSIIEKDIKKKKKNETQNADKSTQENDSEHDEKETVKVKSSDIDLNDDSTSDEEVDKKDDSSITKVSEMDSINERHKGDENQDQDEDAFDERRRYAEEISIIEYDEINFLPEIFLQLHSEVVWFKTPFPVTWDDDKKYWSTKKGMKNVKYDEEKMEISFRLDGHRTPIALAVPRYINLPYTSWELKPICNNSEEEVKVEFSIYMVQISITFTIVAQNICISKVGGPVLSSPQYKNIMDNWIGKFYKVDKMIEILEIIGIDVFPAHDAYVVLPSITPKQWICESHTYMCMALACTTHHFKSSKWNKLKEHKTLIFSFKEVFSFEQFSIKFKLVSITPERAKFLDFDENAETFDESEEERSEFYPDLNYLIQKNSSNLTKSRMKNINKDMCNTVYDVLTRSKVFSYG